MLNRIKALFAEDTRAEEKPAGFDEATLAAAALLVRAALMDSRFGAEERQAVEAALKDSFGLSDEETAALISEAEAENAEATDLYRWTSKLRDALDADERVKLIERLWEIVYADGRLDDFEANLLRRVAGLIYVPDRDSGAARQRARQKLGLA
ncbi:TerB family tellurite resistance protein [Tepidicaulis sp. LMO-SS28]|uniref:tellurite resistance TerB family protein n=1 Tax=Tepidicaulis sp. LMO-SS28 TaxID=3447455 RepID=UPI003EDEA72D